MYAISQGQVPGTVPSLLRTCALRSTCRACQAGVLYLALADGDRGSPRRRRSEVVWEEADLQLPVEPQESQGTKAPANTHPIKPIPGLPDTPSSWFRGAAGHRQVAETFDTPPRSLDQLPHYGANSSTHGLSRYCRHCDALRTLDVKNLLRASLSWRPDLGNFSLDVVHYSTQAC